MPKLDSKNFKGAKEELFGEAAEKRPKKNYKEGRDRYNDIGSKNPNYNHGKRTEEQMKGKKDEYVTKAGTEINASKVIKLVNLKGPFANEGGKFSVIATQWPLTSRKYTTVDSFWDLVIMSKKVSTIVVLGPIDTKKGKYWSEGQTTENWKVTKCETKQENSDYTVYKIKVNGINKRENNSKQITLYHYANWEDKKLPTNKDNFEKFVKMLGEKKLRKIVIHCSAGIGRTGVLSACLYSLIADKDNDDPIAIIKDMRKYRYKMVQTPEQFEFVCKFILRNVVDEQTKYNKIGWEQEITKYLEDIEEEMEDLEKARQLNLPEDDIYERSDTDDEEDTDYEKVQENIIKLGADEVKKIQKYKNEITNILSKIKDKSATISIEEELTYDEENDEIEFKDDDEQSIGVYSIITFDSTNLANITYSSSDCININQPPELITSGYNTILENFEQNVKKINTIMEKYKKQAEEKAKRIRAEKAKRIGAEKAERIKQEKSSEAPEINTIRKEINKLIETKFDKISRLVNKINIETDYVDVSEYIEHGPMKFVIKLGENNLEYIVGSPINTLKLNLQNYVKNTSYETVEDIKKFETNLENQLKEIITQTKKYENNIKEYVKTPDYAINKIEEECKDDINVTRIFEKYKELVKKLTEEIIGEIGKHVGNLDMLPNNEKENLYKKSEYKGKKNTIKIKFPNESKEAEIYEISDLNTAHLSNAIKTHTEYLFEPKEQWPNNEDCGEKKELIKKFIPLLQNTLKEIEKGTKEYVELIMPYVESIMPPEKKDPEEKVTRRHGKTGGPQEQIQYEILEDEKKYKDGIKTIKLTVNKILEKETEKIKSKEKEIKEILSKVNGPTDTTVKIVKTLKKLYKDEVEVGGKHDDKYSVITFSPENLKRLVNIQLTYFDDENITLQERAKSGEKYLEKLRSTMRDINNVMIDYKKEAIATVKVEIIEEINKLLNDKGPEIKEKATKVEKLSKDVNLGAEKGEDFHQSLEKRLTSLNKTPKEIKKLIGKPSYKLVDKNIFIEYFPTKEGMFEEFKQYITNEVCRDNSDILITTDDLKGRIEKLLDAVSKKLDRYEKALTLLKQVKKEEKQEKPKEEKGERFTKENLEKLREELFPFEHEGRRAVKIISGYKLKNYEKIKNYLENEYGEQYATSFEKYYNRLYPGRQSEKGKELSEKDIELLSEVFPNIKLGSLTSNSKKQFSGDKYETKSGKEIDASKVVRLKGMPGSDATNLSIIATQWPNNLETVNAFWDMVCNAKQVKTIVCLARKTEKKQDLVYYWLKENYKKGGAYEKASYKVIKTTKQNMQDYHVDMYELTIQGPDKKIWEGVKVYQYINWPDGNIPENPDKFEAFVHYLNDILKVKKLVVHCRAGAGRTGVFCACLYALRTNQKDVAGIIKDLRKYRTQMIQIDRQFDFTYKFVLRNVGVDPKINKDNIIRYEDDLKEYLSKKEVKIEKIKIKSTPQLISKQDLNEISSKIPKLKQDAKISVTWKDKKIELKISEVVVFIHRIEKKYKELVNNGKNTEEFVKYTKKAITDIIAGINSLLLKHMEMEIISSTIDKFIKKILSEFQMLRLNDNEFICTIAPVDINGVKKFKVFNVTAGLFKKNFLNSLKEGLFAYFVNHPDKDPQKDITEKSNIPQIKIIMEILNAAKKLAKEKKENEKKQKK